MNIKANRSELVCRTCNAPLRGDEPLGGHCLACLLDPALDQDQGSASKSFDHYQLATHADGTPVELGRGAMGVTYRAIDTVLGYQVALKVIDSRMAADRDARDRFLSEARAAARLRHPNVASVFYYGVAKAGGRCFYAMELVLGETLEARLRRTGPLPVVLALEVVSQIARALVAAQNEGLVHRDLKPANLMLAGEAELIVKVIDFGVAKALATTKETDPGRTVFVGTPAFASPEQLAGARVDGRSDLYSLGVTLWQMLTGKLPFKGSQAELEQQHLRAPLPVDQLHSFPRPVVTLLRTLLEKDPGRRFQNPAELLKALSTIKNGIGVQRRVTRRSLNQTRPANGRAGSRQRRAGPEPEKVSLARLPITGSELFGREEDIAFLDSAWADPRVHIVTIVAWAGVGKSTLVNHWLRRIAAEQYRSGEIIYGWSFYNQGSREGSSSADEFLDAALTWFDDPDPRKGTAWEKGERLAKLVTRRRTLLILDGLEPFQNPPGPQEGRVREPSLRALLRDLAAFNRGLCVITTRLPVTDLADHERTSAPRHDLEHLRSEAGAKLLRALSVQGPEEELRNASDEFGGHCLALTLLGSYLADAYQGDICWRQEVSTQLTQDIRQGVHARKVMETYQSWLGEGPELSVLRMLGLFDRPAEEKAFEALLKPPPIPGLTDSLVDSSLTVWRTILSRLRRSTLLAREDVHNPAYLDAHPLVREYFGDQLRSQCQDAWRESNRRLYQYYRMRAPHLPESLIEMEPLFLAVICGCNAGLFRDALHEVYIPRIQRGSACFAANTLGARVPLLSVLAHFFEHGRWGAAVKTSFEEQSLTSEDELFVLMQAGLYLTATRGLGDPEARSCYERAEPLCDLLGRPVLLHVALVGQWRYSLNTDKLSVAMHIAKRVYALARRRNDSELVVAAYRALAATRYFLGDFKASRTYAMHALEIWRSGGKQSAVEEPITPAVSCLCYQALSDWHFGRLADCRAATVEAISLAKELNDTHALAQALWFAGFVGHFERSPVEVEGVASELIELSTRQSFAAWLSRGVVLRGWARCARGDMFGGISWIEDGLRGYRATTSVLDLPYLLALQSEALHLADRTSEGLEAIKEAQALIERYEQRWWSAELSRLSGVFLAAIGADKAQIEASFAEAIRTAKQQRSISLTLRAEATCAEFRRQWASAPQGCGVRLSLR